ncbi:MAG: SGNH/GDSL hydrolase family protein [Verrucomicrobiota bacterium]|nr:SGNH/GDSL hydrolase family protein [Verrucomicrobiota bacterium]
MTFTKKFTEIRKKKKNGEKVRVLAFGSSNTERFIPGQHWLDCFELTIKHKCGRIHHCINSGTGGETTRDLLRRFDADAAFYRPDLVFLTIGGNDANPLNNLGADEYEKNLYKLYERFQEMECFVIFQTYYSPIDEEEQEKRNVDFFKNMDIVRKVANKTHSGLIDHLKFWQPLKLKRPEKHLELMNDAWHVNTIGNIILGLTIARCFDVELEKTHEKFYSEAIIYFNLMKNLVKK